MATPEAKQRMLDRQIRRSRILSEQYGTPDEVEKFNETINQPTLGDTDLEKINIITAVNDMWEHISGVEVSEEELGEEEKIYEYDPNAEEDEPTEWKPSYQQEQGSGQGVISDEVAEAVGAGDAEGQEAEDSTEDISPEDQGRAESDISTNDEENEESSEEESS